MRGSTWNVPDDWNCYWRVCSFCGGRYHASEGGCDCLSDLTCQCEECDWQHEQWGETPWEGGPVEHTLRCRKCGTGPATETFRKVSTHTARKPQQACNGEIRPGDRYQLTVWGGYYPGGRRWREFSKKRVEKGPGWDDELQPAVVS